VIRKDEKFCSVRLRSYTKAYGLAGPSVLLISTLYILRPRCRDQYRHSQTYYRNPHRILWFGFAYGACSYMSIERVVMIPAFRRCRSGIVPGIEV